jgi:hypothetical protein
MRCTFLSCCLMTTTMAMMIFYTFTSANTQDAAQHSTS